MPLTTPPTLTVPLYARNNLTGETFLVRAQMPGPTGPTGPQGVNTIIISGFGPDVGGTGTPSNLPADGLLAAGFAATNSPQYQMNLGEALYYQETGAPDDGFLFQYVSGIAGVPWVSLGLIQGPKGDLGNTGPTGPTGAQGDDIFVGPDDPSVVKPTTELWYDTDDTRILGPTDLPLGGTVGRFLIKKTDLDGDVEWSGVNGRTAYVGDNAGYFFTGNGGIFKKSGGGWVLRKHNNNAAIAIENNDGTAGTNIITADGNVAMTGSLKWGNNEGDKILLYPGATPGTNSYGFGISASAMALFVPDNCTFRFRDGGGHDGGQEYMTLTHNLADINAPLQANSIDVAASHIQISGSTVSNSAHFYVGSDGNDSGSGSFFKVLEGRQLDNKPVFDIQGYVSAHSGGQPEGQMKILINCGDDGYKEHTQFSMKDGGGQPRIHCHGDISALHFEDRDSFRAGHDDDEDLDLSLASKLIDRLTPFTYTSVTPPGVGASPNRVPPPPEHHLSISIEDIEGSGSPLVPHLIHSQPDDPDRGHDINALLVVAIAEIKNLRTRTAELEAANATFEARLAALEARC